MSVPGTPRLPQLTLLTELVNSLVSPGPLGAPGGWGWRSLWTAHQDSAEGLGDLPRVSVGFALVLLLRPQSQASSAWHHTGGSPCTWQSQRE